MRVVWRPLAATLGNVPEGNIEQEHPDMIRQTERLAALRELIPIPPHVHALAAVVSYDLRHGPAWARIPAEGIEAFTVDDSASDAESLEEDQAERGGRIVAAFSDDITAPLRTFLGELPAVYLDADSGEVSLTMPQHWVPGLPRNVEVFWFDGERVAEGDCWTDEAGELAAPGWYWWTCCPGCMPDSDPFGPFETEAEAEADAIECEDAADGEGEGCWADNENAYEIDASDVITALFGRTIASEFPL